MNLEDIAKNINITRTTLYNWKKSKPLLYKIIISYFNNIENTKKEDKKINELIKYFKELDEEEKELYIAEIKARALRKKLG